MNAQTTYMPGDTIVIRPLPGMPTECATVIHEQGRNLWVRLDDGRKLNVSKSAVEQNITEV